MASAIMKVARRNFIHYENYVLKVVDKENGLPHETRKNLWKRLVLALNQRTQLYPFRIGEMGLFGVTASSDFGGSDMSYLDQVML